MATTTYLVLNSFLKCATANEMWHSIYQASGSEQYSHLNAPTTCVLYQMTSIICIIFSSAKKAAQDLTHRWSFADDCIYKSHISEFEIIFIFLIAKPNQKRNNKMWIVCNTKDMTIYSIKKQKNKQRNIYYGYRHISYDWEIAKISHR